MSRSLIALILTLGAFVLIGFVVWPNYQDLVDLQKRSTELGAKLVAQQDYLARLGGVVQSLERDPLALAKVDAGIPSKPDFGRLTNFLSSSSAKSGLILSNITSISVSPVAGSDPASPQGLKEIHLTAEMAGTYPALKAFLREMEQSARLVEVDRVSLSSLQSSGIVAGQGQLGASYRYEISLKASSY